MASIPPDKLRMAAYGQVYQTANPKKPKTPDVRLYVTVNDKELRKAGVDFDGKEEAFALVPTRVKEKGKTVIKWVEHELAYAGTQSDRGGNTYDRHELLLPPKGVNLNDLRNLGVAYGLRTNDGKGHVDTQWLQYGDSNFKLR
jgi:hypothetical protein